MTKFISIDRILEYEIHSSFICKHLNIGWLQRIAAWYYGNLARRKHNRYLISLIERERVKSRLQEMTP